MKSLFKIFAYTHLRSLKGGANKAKFNCQEKWGNHCIWCTKAIVGCVFFCCFVEDDTDLMTKGGNLPCFGCSYDRVCVFERKKVNYKNEFN